VLKLSELKADIISRFQETGKWEMPKRKGSLPKHVKDYILQNYATQSQSQIAENLGVPKHTVKNFARYMGLRKDPNPSGRFQKGGKAWNKGTHFNPPGSHKGHFKKGHLPHNTKDGDGVITTRHLGSKKNPPYKYIRLGLGKWRELHRHLWEEAHGPIPRDHMVVFRNGDTLDCRLENLELITRGENAKRNYNRDKAVANGPWVNLSDNYVAHMMTAKKGDSHLKEEIKKYPELIELGRANMKLKREIKKQAQK
jgi:hypothetical protein